MTPALEALLADGRIRHLPGRFDPAWLEGAWLVVAATDDRDVNATVSAAAQARRIFSNVVDDPELSSFQVPSIVDRSPVIVAISSSGVAPVLARRLRERIESLFDHSLGRLAALAERYRARIRAGHPDLGARRRFYDWLLDGPVAGLLRQQRPEAAAAALDAALAQPLRPAEGSVVLVGAGPGDPGLLTLKALRALNEADVILYDRLVSDEVMSLARRDAERVAVGKLPGEDHHATQARIHALLVEHARAGRRVVRLKGGDAFIFGRGGEELEHLRAHGVRYEVVPGITAALACAAYAGIPLTHRELRAIGAPGDGALPRGRGQSGLAGVGARAADAGVLHGRGPAGIADAALDPPRPRAGDAVRADRKRQPARAAGAVGRAARPAATGAGARHPFPALLIVGEVAGLAQSLHWFGEHLEGAPQRLAA